MSRFFPILALPLVQAIFVISDDGLCVVVVVAILRCLFALLTFFYCNWHGIKMGAAAISVKPILST